MIEPKKIMNAVVNLREHTGLSQSVFAVKYLGKTLPTQQRYEGVVPPPQEVLLMLRGIARDLKRDDLAELFLQAAIETVPPELQKLIRESESNEPKTTSFKETPIESRVNRRKASGG